MLQARTDTRSSFNFPGLFDNNFRTQIYHGTNKEKCISCVCFSLQHPTYIVFARYTLLIDIELRSLAPILDFEMCSLAPLMKIELFSLASPLLRLNRAL